MSRPPWSTGPSQQKGCWQAWFFVWKKPHGKVVLVSKFIISTRMPSTTWKHTLLFNRAPTCPLTAGWPGLLQLEKGTTFMGLGDTPRDGVQVCKHYCRSWTKKHHSVPKIPRFFIIFLDWGHSGDGIKKLLGEDKTLQSKKGLVMILIWLM